jgi:isocitrate/isopropylmalate dehydrogenase
MRTHVEVCEHTYRLRHQHLVLLPRHFKFAFHSAKSLLRARQGVSAYVSMRQHTSACVSMRQHTSAYVNVSHTSAYVSIRQHTSAYVSIRQHSSAYVSIRQHTSAYAGVELASSAPWSAACFTNTKVETLHALLVQHIFPYLSTYFTNTGVCWRAVSIPLCS